MKSGLHRYNESAGYRVFTICNYLFLSLVAAITLIPFLYVFSISVSTQEALAAHGFTIFPKSLDFSNFQYIFEYNGKRLLTSYGNTLFVTLIGTPLNVLFTAMLAYPLAKKSLPYRNILVCIVFFTMLFNAGLIPTYLVVSKTGLLNSLWSMILPSLVSVWNMLLMRNFFMTIPESLEESAQIDGAGTLRILFSIILPLSLPAMFTIGLFYAVDHWNDWFTASIYITDIEKQPMMLYMRDILTASKAAEQASTSSTALMTQIPSEGIKNATVILAIFPILCGYPFVQKYFVKGVLVGSVKG